MDIYLNGFSSFGSSPATHFGAISNGLLRDNSKAAVMAPYFIAHPESFIGQELSVMQLLSRFEAQGLNNLTYDHIQNGLRQLIKADLFVAQAYKLENEARTTNVYLFKSQEDFQKDIKIYTIGEAKAQEKRKEVKAIALKKTPYVVDPNKLEWSKDHPLGLTPDEAVLAEAFGSGADIGTLRRKPPQGWKDEQLDKLNKHLLFKFDFKANYPLKNFLVNFYRSWRAAVKEGIADEKKEKHLNAMVRQLVLKSKSPVAVWIAKQCEALRQQTQEDDPSSLVDDVRFYWQQVYQNKLPPKPATTSLYIIG